MPPCAKALMGESAWLMPCAALSIWLFHPPSSCAKVTGIASIKWGRPVLTTSANSDCLSARV
ncbi:Uncharacterised protein [Vibrio cholerae]|nr:Uncharacterised protein [Vibrio cholerae]